MQRNREVSICPNLEEPWRREGEVGAEGPEKKEAESPVVFTEAPSS